ncbi:MAG: hypothetical protein NZ899_06495 [Thermoguttaceae bacterium]|nr:hypothetical protein [Thermoguttaceae bacterium]MDW8079189.1 hypothetical protein [Thermoguttaceae bacterium]
MHEEGAVLLQEYWSACERPLRVDKRNAVIRGVKLLGLRSRNGRVYLPQALSEACPLYEGAKVNVNHGHVAGCPVRDYRDRIGIVRNVQFVDGQGLFADLVYNPKHALAEQLVYDAEHLPENVGLSHNVLARIRQEGDDTVVEAILHVYSVDLVADPATTSGLFEGELPSLAGGSFEKTSPHRRGANQTQVTAAGDCPWVACCRGAFRPDGSKRGQCSGEAEEALRGLREEVDHLQQKLARAERTLVIWRTLAEFGLPLPTGSGSDPQIVDDHLLERLYQLTDEGEVRRLIGRQAELWRERQARMARGGQGAAFGGCTPSADDIGWFIRAICPEG